MQVAIYPTNLIKLYIYIYSYIYIYIYIYAAKRPDYGQYLDLAAFHKDDFDAFCIIICSV